MNEYLRYEITDEQWRRLEPLLPPERDGKRGRPRKDNRTMVNGMLWMSRSGAQWRLLPERHGPWRSVYARFAKWRRDGVWNRVLARPGRDMDPENQSIDSACVKVHASSNGGGRTENKAVGRTKGRLNTKTHAAVDGLGNPAAFLLSPGNDHDSTRAIELLRKTDTRGSNVLADKAYGASGILFYVGDQGAAAVIPPKSNAKELRPVDYCLYKERRLVECFFQKIKWFRRVATIHDNIDASFLAFVCLSAIMIWFL